MAVFNYKKILIIKFSYDFLCYDIINEFDIKINGNCMGLNNFGFDDETYEIQNPLINNVLDMNNNEIISFGIRLEEKYIGTIWQKNKRQESQILDFNSNNKNFIFNINSVLKYDENKFAILEKNNNDGLYFNVKIYTYSTPYNSENDSNLQSPSQEIEETSNNSNVNIIKGNICNKINSDEKIKNNGINENNYEKDENTSNENSEENIDEILQEIKINAEKREEEYIKLEKKQKNYKIENEDIIIIKKKIFTEVFNLEKIKSKKNLDLCLIKINSKIFSFLDDENIILIDFEKCSIISKINYGLNNTLTYLDKTPNNNLLFKEKNKIISYHLNKNDLKRIYLPVYEYNEKRKNKSKWCLISGNNTEDFINKAKIIDNNFMISLFEFRMEKWNLNQDYLN